MSRRKKAVFTVVIMGLMLIAEAVLLQTNLVLGLTMMFAVFVGVTAGIGYVALLFWSPTEMLRFWIAKKKIQRMQDNIIRRGHLS